MDFKHIKECHLDHDHFYYLMNYQNLGGDELMTALNDICDDVLDHELNDILAVLDIRNISMNIEALTFIRSKKSIDAGKRVRKTAVLVNKTNYMAKLTTDSLNFFFKLTGNTYQVFDNQSDALYWLSD